MLYRKLAEKEMLAFIAWAEKYDPPDLTKWEIYHPLCRDTWLKRGIKPNEK